MYYTVNKESLLDRIGEEVSLVADEAYGENGASLYDSIVLTEKDSEAVGRLVSDSIGLFVARTFDICKRYTTDTSGGQSGESLYFHVPDMDETLEDRAREEIDSFIVLSTCAMIFQARRPEAVQRFAERAAAAANKAVAFLKSRKSPIDLW